MPLIALAGLAPSLRCPACGAALAPDLVTCTGTGCRYAAVPFTLVAGQPVLVDADDSIVDPAEVAAAVPRQASRVAKALAAIGPRNAIAPRMAAAIVDDAARITGRRPLVLVVGGGTVGSGLEELYAAPGIDIASFDIFPTAYTQVVADAHRIPLIDASVDAVVVQAVLEHVLDPWRVVAEIHRVLRPGGLVYADTPFLQQVHEGPHDFTRFTESGHRWLFRQFELVESGVVAGPGEQLVWSLGHAARTVFPWRPAAAALRLAARPLAAFIDRFGSARHAVDGASAVYFLGRRSERTLGPREMLGHYGGAQGQLRRGNAAAPPIQYGREGEATLNVVVLKTLTAFDAVKDRWDALFAADPSAQLFLAHAWLRAYLSIKREPWLIVTLYDGPELIAAVPLSLHGVPHRLFALASELRFAGDQVSDYSGMLCAPHHETAAIARLADHLAAMRWHRGTFSDVRDERFAAVVARLAATGLRIEAGEERPCFAIDLPATYDEFLGRLSYGTRRRTVRPMKVLTEKLPAFRTSAATPEDADAHIDAVIALNTTRWNGTAVRAQRLRSLLRATFAAGCLRVHVLWDGARPIAGGAAFTDAVHGTYGFYLVAHDEEYDEHGPGKAVLDVLVREAIAGGFRVFDFMRGDDAYKRSYATQSTPIRSYVAIRSPRRESLLHAVDPAYQALRAAAIRYGARRPAPARSGHVKDGALRESMPAAQTAER